ncbi:hypothetical protein DFH94DRAFT_855025 [Russula ochroleuca]|uniref:Uncharacterized protein n=1 Tax=Russula ochroleuca TaxID=152965 RepID=A0A9P5MSU4_9AGAM|nr:hypothetical protein DFH94DRAFT_855025 [Russula ochroleuca]
MHQSGRCLDRRRRGPYNFFIKGPTNHSNDAHQSFSQFLLVPLFTTSQGFRTLIMSLRAVLLSSLFFFSGFAAAGISAPSCSSSTWSWTSNSLGQSACTVAAFMMSTCNGGSFTINPLLPGNAYSGPSGSDDSNLCKCNTIAYSLLSACDACQGAEWISWTEYISNCTEVELASTFPNPVPAGTSVPLWAFIDVTIEGTWDSISAAIVGDTPEAGPGTIL